MENKEIVKSYFKEFSIVQSQLDSFNYFIEQRVKAIIIEHNESKIPEYLLETYEELNLDIGDVWLEEPKHVEVDGSETKLTPQIARLRGLTYSAPLKVKISATTENRKEEFEVQIAKLPIMLKSSKCVLTNKTKNELIELGEDPGEPGGYFIVNGTEKVVVLIEDLSLNKFFIGKDEELYGRMYSERGAYKTLQEIKKNKEGQYAYSFGNFKNIPIFLLIKVLGILKDKEIVDSIGITDTDVLFQISEYSSLNSIDDALEVFSKKIGLVGNTKEKQDRIFFYLDNFVLPHVGVSSGVRKDKAKLITKLFKKYHSVVIGKAKIDDKDGMMNKKVKLAGQLFEQLFINNFSELIIDILTNFQRMVKRGKFSSMKIIIREQLLTQKINSALALGVWPGGRKGVAQYLKRESYFDMISHLTRIVSPLSTSQENFLARELHPTQFGRICPIETPEGSAIGLRKNLSLLATVTYENHPGDVLLKKKIKELL